MRRWMRVEDEAEAEDMYPLVSSTDGNPSRSPSPLMAGGEEIADGSVVSVGLAQGVLSITSYGNDVRGATKMVIENSYLDNVKDPYFKDRPRRTRQARSIVVDSIGRQEIGGSAFTLSSVCSRTLDTAADLRLAPHLRGPGLLHRHVSNPSR